MLARIGKEEDMTASVDICICTFRRPHIANTLRSLAALELPPGQTIHIIVVDNDDTPSASSIVRESTTATGLDITYLHAPARNISIARNACLDNATAPLTAFLDDDELATPGWLAALLNEMKKSGADAVLGPVRALYAPNMPVWMKRGDFHATLPVWVAGTITTGYTCNVLLQREKALALRFRPELGRSGGEDTAFFAQFHKAGGCLAFAEAALLTETVTPERASLNWLLRRRFRFGQTHGLLLLESMEFARWPRVKALVLTMAKTSFCGVMALITLPSAVRWRFWLLRGAVHLGTISRLLGQKEMVQYG